MKVRDVMTAEARVCRPETNLAAAAEIMWNSNCGVLPVVEDGGNVIGMITDRDICIAVGTRGRLASDISAKDVISGQVFICLPDTEIHDALEMMRMKAVRRLAVVNSLGQFHGLFSIEDAACHAQADGKKRTELSTEDVAITLKAICEGQLEQRVEQGVQHLAAAN